MKNLILLFLAIITISCNDNDDQPETPTPFMPVTITPTLISKHNYGVSSAGISEQQTIYNESTSWNSFLNQIESYYLPLNYDYLAQHFSETTIDFTNYTVIAVFDQVYSNGGHSIDITNITEYENNIVVSVQNLLPGNVSQVASQPYHIVKIPKAKKPIVFQ
ncbi:MAG: protease complex subunit PrcB family protein [Flavobacteriaceae bacterium]|nr:MAG: protease complex subunit PrcB family protein [Flavobacteriaceae bacterium]